MDWRMVDGSACGRYNTPDIQHTTIGLFPTSAGVHHFLPIWKKIKYSGREGRLSERATHGLAQTRPELGELGRARVAPNIGVGREDALAVRIGLCRTSDGWCVCEAPEWRRGCLRRRRERRAGHAVESEEDVEPKDELGFAVACSFGRVARRAWPRTCSVTSVTWLIFPPPRPREAPFRALRVPSRTTGSSRTALSLLQLQYTPQIIDLLISPHLSFLATHFA